MNITPRAVCTSLLLLLSFLSATFLDLTGFQFFSIPRTNWWHKYNILHIFCKLGASRFHPKYCLVFRSKNIMEHNGDYHDLIG